MNCALDIVESWKGVDEGKIIFQSFNDLKKKTNSMYVFTQRKVIDSSSTA